MKGKEKVYHASLLKKYFERDEATTEGAVAVVKADDHFRKICTVKLKKVK